MPYYRTIRYTGCKTSKRQNVSGEQFCSECKAKVLIYNLFPAVMLLLNASLVLCMRYAGLLKASLKVWPSVTAR